MAQATTVVAGVDLTSNNNTRSPTSLSNAKTGHQGINK